MSRADARSGSFASGSSRALTHSRYGGIVIALALTYFLAAKVGLLFAFETRQVTAIWPPTGLAIVAYALFGFRIWPGVWVGAFLANVSMSEPATAAGIAVGNTLAGVVGLHLAQRLGDFRPNLARVRDVLALALFGAAAGSAVSATSGTLALLLAGTLPVSKAASVWWLWWVGDSLGVLLIAPVLLTWIAPRPLSWSSARFAEAAALLLSVIFCNLFVLAGFGGVGFAATQLRYLAFPLLIWAGLRFGARETALTALLVAGFAIGGAIHNRGPFVGGTLDERLVQLDLFLGVVAVTALLIGAVLSERRIAEEAREATMEQLRAAGAALRVADARYRRIFDSGMVGVVVSDAATGLVLEANDAFLAMVGYDRADVEEGRLGGAVLNVPEASEAQEVARRQLHERGFTHPWQKEFVRKDGTRVAVLVANALLDAPICVNVIVDMTAQRRAEDLARVVETARAAEGRFLELLTQAPLGISVVRADLRIAHVNPAFARMFGYEDSPSTLIGSDSLELVHPDDVIAGPAHPADRLAGPPSSAPKPRPARCVRRDGSSFFIETIGIPATFAGEVSILYVSRDVTTELAAEAARRAAEEDVRKQKVLLEGILESVDEGVFAVEPSRKTIAMNAAARSIVGRSFPRDHLPEDWRDRIRAVREDGSTMDPKDAPLARAIQGEASEDVVYRVTPNDASAAADAGVWVSTTARPIRDAGGQIIAAVATLRDITEQRAKAEKLRDQSMTDELTGLMNRRGFLTLATARLAEARRTRAPMALLYADLNGLKRINDELGHPQGDRAIKDAARVLRAVFRKGDLVARLGGDEFAAFLPNFAPAARDPLLTRLEVVIRGHELEERPFRLSMSYGVTFVDWERGASLEELLAEADQSMYERKRARAGQSSPYVRAVNVPKG